MSFPDMTPTELLATADRLRHQRERLHSSTMRLKAHAKTLSSSTERLRRMTESLSENYVDEDESE
jgi:hypothetical protein